jgi:hypothetical protein
MYVGLVNGNCLKVQLYRTVLYRYALENGLNERDPEVQARPEGTAVLSENSGNGYRALLNGHDAEKYQYRKGCNGV